MPSTTRDLVPINNRKAKLRKVEAPTMIDVGNGSLHDKKLSMMAMRTNEYGKVYPPF